MIFPSMGMLPVAYGVHNPWLAHNTNSAALANNQLDAIGVTAIFIAFFDASKHSLNERVLRSKQPTPSHEDERQTLAEFMPISAIAICMEALVFSFRARKINVDTPCYPTPLLLDAAAVAISLRIISDTVSGSGQRN